MTHKRNPRYVNYYRHNSLGAILWDKLKQEVLPAFLLCTLGTAVLIGSLLCKPVALITSIICGIVVMESEFRFFSGLVYTIKHWGEPKKNLAYYERKRRNAAGCREIRRVMEEQQPSISNKEVMEGIYRASGEKLFREEVAFRPVSDETIEGEIEEVYRSFGWKAP